MPRRFFKRMVSDNEHIREHRYLRFFGNLLSDPNILHFNRRSVSGAFSLGLFVAFVPLPFQMVIAALGAIVLRVNLPIAACLVWITNPVTMPALYYFAYKVGTIILQVPTQQIEFEFSFSWLVDKMGVIWEPLLLGCLVLGILAALAGNLFVRIFWRIHVIKAWKARKLKKQQRLAERRTSEAGNRHP